MGLQEEDVRLDLNLAVSKGFHRKLAGFEARV
jgi:hypothetical protein